MTPTQQKQRDVLFEKINDLCDELAAALNYDPAQLFTGDDIRAHLPVLVEFCMCMGDADYPRGFADTQEYAAFRSQVIDCMTNVFTQDLSQFRRVCREIARQARVMALGDELIANGEGDYTLAKLMVS